MKGGGGSVLSDFSFRYELVKIVPTRGGLVKPWISGIDSQRKDDYAKVVLAQPSIIIIFFRDLCD